MKKIFLAVAVAVALTVSMVAGTASARTTTPNLTCVDGLGHVFFSSGNVCPSGDINAITLSEHLRCVEPDGVIIEVFSATCPVDDILLSSDGLSFGGSFGARLFPSGFDFGSLSDQQAAQDANACAAAIAFIETQHLGPQHRAAAIGLIAQLQQCQNRTGSNSSSFWPF